MRHRSEITRLGRVKNKRLALMRSLARSLIVHGRIETTEARAKALRPFVERLVTRAKSDNLLSKRLLIARLGNREREAMRLINDIAPKYKDRAGGYTRITKIGSTRMDAAPMAVIEFV